MNLIDLYSDLKELNVRIDHILKKSGYMDEEQLYLSSIPKNPDDCFLLFELNKVMGDLLKANERLNYLERPIITEGYISIDGNGRLRATATDSKNDRLDWTYSSGSGIEFLLTYYDEDEEEYIATWRTSRIEYGEDGYYIYHYPEVSLEGLKVRKRQ